MKIVIGCDEAALELKQYLIEELRQLGHKIEDVGVYNELPTLYPDIAEDLCKKIIDNSNQRGILLCGTGIGMAITANKIPGIRAAVAHDMFSLERMILSNDCQVLCMGARIIAPQTSLMLVKRWLELDYIDGPSTRKIDRIKEVESHYRKGERACKEL